MKQRKAKNKMNLTFGFVTDNEGRVLSVIPKCAQTELTPLRDYPDFHLMEFLLSYDENDFLYEGLLEQIL